MKNKSPLTDKEKLIFIKNQNKVSRDEEVIIKISDKYFKVKELG